MKVFKTTSQDRETLCKKFCLFFETQEYPRRSIWSKSNRYRFA